MAIRFECPHCGKGIKAPEGSSGKTMPCLFCKKEFIIPDKTLVRVPEEEPLPEAQEDRPDVQEKNGQVQTESRSDEDVDQLNADLEEELSRND